MKPTFFATPAAFRAWFEKHHAEAQELLVGFYKKDSGKPSITWPESVDEALCVGWIDGIRKRIDDERYMIRFTPRKARSIWSAVNIERVKELEKLGLMQPAGRKAFQARTEDKSVVYAYEQKQDAQLTGPYEKQLKANKKAWAFFQAQAPWYQRTASWWVISAKQEKTREKRLATLIEDSENGRTLRQFTRTPKPARP